MNPKEVAAALKELWNSGYRKLATYGVVAFAAVTALLLFANGYTVSALGKSVTKEDQKRQTDTIYTGITGVSDKLDSAFTAYDANVKAYLRAERELAVDTTLKPLLKMMFGMKGELKELQSLQRTTQNRVSELPAAYEGALRGIIEEQPPDRSAAMMEEIMRKLDRMQLTVDTLRRQRNSSKKF